MRWARFSRRQRQALTWWCPGSPYRDWDGVICDGAVRSGKTLCLSLSFLLWSMGSFGGRDFALCGKTVTALRRNLVLPLLPLLEELGFACALKTSRNLLEVECGRCKNRYHLFGGRDEGSAALIQGVTLAGILLDEAALMPRSFVEQGLARCSVEGSRFWFSCNPEHPGHWFYREWICRARERRMLLLRFRMEDNPALAPAVCARYESLYTGAFYRRFVKGEWVAAGGLVYPMYDPARHVTDLRPQCARYRVSCDYGTVNPASFGLWGEWGERWIRLEERYYDSHREGAQKTDEEYADLLEGLVGALPVEVVLVDPSAASFIQCLRRRERFAVQAADNRVLDGIRMVGALLQGGRLLIHESCEDTLRELAGYRWEEGGERPRKENDHAMDDLRYFAAHLLGGEEAGFCALAAGGRERR